MMRARWRALWADLHAEGDPDAVFEGLAGRYSETGRAYHTLGHIAHVLDEIDLVLTSLESPACVQAAVWFHDAVYDPRRSDNEERSAGLARAAWTQARVMSTRVAQVEDLILATKHDRRVAGDAAFLVDADLAILGQGPEAFDRYESQIRVEYGWVAEPQYVVGRGVLLRGFLAREAIFATQPFRRRYETRARLNLARALDRLKPQALAEEAR